MLRAEVRDFADKPLALIGKHNTDFTVYTVSIDPDGFPDPVRWALIAGDALCNYRSALDHLVHELAVVNTRKNPPPRWRQLAFPITKSAADFQECVKRGHLSGLSDVAIALIKETQPYHRPSDHRGDLLLRLKQLNNADKHRILNLALPTVKKADLKFSSIPDDKIEEVWVNDQPVEPGEEFAKVTLKERHEGLEVTLDVRADFVFWDEGGVMGSMIEVISGIGDEVRWVVGNI
jgi:hypothetical protein